MSHPAVVTERMIFSGRVQGVGFRYTACTLAKRHPVTGFVRNLPDRTVELVACGTRSAIDGLLTDLSRHFGAYISDTRRQPFESNERFETFDVRYGLVKAASFGVAVTLIGCNAGLATRGGAQGVGAAATRAVVLSAVAILVLDAFWAVVWLLGHTP